MDFSLAHLAALLPIIALATGACIVLVLDAALKGPEHKAILPAVSLASIAAAALFAATVWGEVVTLPGGVMRLGPFAGFLGLVVLGAGAVTIMSSGGYARALGFDVGEYFGLLLFALSGMVYLVIANDLVTAFIAFELMSLSVYSLAAIHRRDARGYEGAMKYFILGAFSSAFLLFGMALIYGASGTIYLDRMAAIQGPAQSGLVLGGAGLILIGLAFKVGAVPFHSWIPDAYQGAPAAVTGFMAVAVKAAAFGILIRILSGAGLLAPDLALQAAAAAGEPILRAAEGPFTLALWVLAFLTMALGNLIALAQENLKRLFAYSGIAHTGYLLVAITAATRPGPAAESAIAGALFYLAGYAVTTLAVFTVLVILRQGGRDLQNVSDLAGLSRERPGAALCLTLALMSLVGMPPLAGFIGKVWIFKAAVESGFVGLVIVACGATAVSVYYYLRPVVLMYTAEPAGIDLPRAGFGARVALVAVTAATVLLGVLPRAAYEMARRGVEGLF